MTLTLSVSPDADAPLRRQLLVDAAVQVAADPRDDLIIVLRERLTSDLGYTALELHAVLLAAAWRNRDQLAAEVGNVYDRQQAVERHDLTEHSECCDGECDCRVAQVRYGVDRCQDCSEKPKLLLDQAVRELVWFLRSTVSDRAVNECAGGTA